MREACSGDADRMKEMILGIVSERGKMQNPVTGSGGMLVGTVAELGAHRTEPSVGTRVATLVSLTLTPLRLDEIVELDPASEQVKIKGQAILFGSGIYAEVPSDLDERTVLSVLDVCGAPAWAARLVEPGMKVVVIGAGGKSGMLVSAQASRKVGDDGRVLGLCWPAETVAAAEDAGAEAVAVDCTDPLAVMNAVVEAFEGELADLVVVCANVPGCEGGAILSCDDEGRVLFFSMATSFSSAALVAEGLGKACEMTIGNGFVPGSRGTRSEARSIGTGSPEEVPTMSTILFVNGTIHTNVGTESPMWVLIADNLVKTVHVGASDETPTADRVVDLQGGTLVPAFRDAHVHLPATGLYKTGLDFRGETKASAILDAYEKRAVGGGMLFGGNFEDPLDEPLLGADLDRVVGDQPALLVRADMHSVIASSALMRELKLEELEGVDLGPDGAPTGYLRELAASEAYKWFESNLPRQQQVDAIRAAVQHAYSKGIAEVHEMFVVEWRGWESAEILNEAIDGVALDVAPFFGTTEVERIVEMGIPRIGGDWFLDGSFGSHTAWMSEPYPGEVPAGSTPTGIAYRSDEEVFDFFFRSVEAGLKVGVHAIGDAAIEQCIATWEKVADKVGLDVVRKLGHRIEHFECATDDHIKRAATLGLRASVQPAFDHYWGGPDELYSRRIGWDRARVMNRFRSMADGGLLMGAGSDSTVTPMDPFLQMYSLRHHHREVERLSPRHAFEMNTVGPAAINGHSHIKGSFEAGMQADLVWLDRDPLAVSDEELLATEVLGTWIAGKRVWPEAEAEAS